MKLRDYQEACVRGNETALLEENAASALNVLPTGTGKTVIFSHLAANWPYGRVLIAAHRDELIRQAAGTVERITGIPPEIEKADEHAGRHGALCASRTVITSVQTQNSGRKDESGHILRRMERFNPRDFGLVVIDEAHRSCAKTYRRMVEFYQQNKDCKVQGWTATPDRHDEQALGQVYERVAFEMQLPEAVKKGWLVRPSEQFVMVEGFDISRVGPDREGDLKASELEEELKGDRRRLQQVAWPTIDVAGDRQGLVYVPGVESAHLLADIMNGHKAGCAAALDGKSEWEHRRQILRAFRRGEIQFLVNVELFTEGFDHPGVEVLSIARPTKSRAKYSQMVGRGTRALPGIIENQAGKDFWRLESPELRCDAIAQSAKPECLVLDFVGNAGRHALVSLGDVLGGDYADEVVARATKNAREKSARGERSDMTDELEEAQAEIERERFERHKHLAVRARYQLRNANAFDRLGILPPREPGWHKGRKPTPKQRSVLERAGVPESELDSLSFVKASRLIDEVFKRRKEGLATFKQVRVLERNGVVEVEGRAVKEMQFAEASAEIDKIAKAQGWGRSTPQTAA